MANELNQSLLRTPSATTSAIAARLLSVLIIGSVSLWAQYEASRGFDVAVINDAPGTPSGRRFDLLFVSNDKATRIILNTSNFVERVLYPGGDTDEEVALVLPKKPVDRVILRLVQLSSSTDPASVGVSPGKKTGEFVIRINSAIMEEKNADAAMVTAVQRGMARVWLWNGRGAPRSLLEGMVEYITILAGLSPSPESNYLVRPKESGRCWTEDDPVAVAQFLRFCEGKRRGFVARLNRAMQEGWEPRMVSAALGIPLRRLCSSYHSVLAATRSATANTTSDSIAEEILNQDT
ncbi:uncharacterized protein [Aristolochia californica]|uniref:uncharacterized protein n=1 Tax=Aristolochia californica TaxID=171875 RepID=UPI0035DF7D1D